MHVSVNGTELGYDLLGDNTSDVLIFQHGYLGTGDIWRPVAEVLAASFRCVILDARGVGSSGRPETGYTVDGAVADIVGVADALAIDRFTYVGHSMGAVIGYQLALTHAVRLRRLVLVCPGPAGPPRAGRHAFAAFREAWAAKDVERMAFLLDSASAVATQPGVLEARAQRAVECGVGHVDDLLDSILPLALRERIPEITTPTLVVVGAADPALPSAITDFGHLPNASLHVFSGIGHVPQLECTDASAHVMQQFFDHGVVNAAALRERADQSHSRGATAVCRPKVETRSSIDESTIASNKALVLAFFEALSTNRLNDAFEMVHPDAELWTLTDRATVTRGEYALLYDRLITTRFVDGGVKLTPGIMTAEADRVSVRCESHGQMKNGKIYNNIYHFLFRIEDGTIRNMWEHADTNHSHLVLRAGD